jgi:manganese/zinc/iron transport system ATP- binding protein
VQQVTAGYPGRDPAIRDVSFQITKGKRVALVGPNGAGKSTLFRAIVGLLPLQTGRIALFGESTSESRQKAAYVPQVDSVDWGFPVSVLDVVLMGLARQIGWLRLPNRYHRELALTALERVGLCGYQHNQIGELSGGQKRRVFIARALAQGADLLLLDEPFAGVDQSAQSALYDLLDQLRDQGVTVLLATHDLNTIQTRFDELLLLNHRLIAYGTPAEVFRPELLTQAFGGQLSIWREGATHPVMMLVD